MTEKPYLIIEMDGIIPIGTKVSFLIYGRGPSGIGSIKWRKVLGTVVDYENSGTNEYPNILYIVQNKVKKLRGRGFVLKDTMVHADDIKVEGLPIIYEANENNGTGGGRTRKKRIRRTRRA